MTARAATAGDMPLSAPRRDTSTLLLYVIGALLLAVAIAWVGLSQRVPAPPPVVTPVDASPAQVTALASPTDVLQELALAELALQAGQLLEPPGGSALDFYRAALAADPSSDAAQAGMAELALRLEARAGEALANSDFATLAPLLGALREADPDGAYAELQSDIDARVADRLVKVDIATRRGQLARARGLLENVIAVPGIDLGAVATRLALVDEAQTRRNRPAPSAAAQPPGATGTATPPATGAARSGQSLDVAGRTAAVRLDAAAVAARQAELRGANGLPAIADQAPGADGETRPSDASPPLATGNASLDSSSATTANSAATASPAADEPGATITVSSDSGTNAPTSAGLEDAAAAQNSLTRFTPTPPPAALDEPRDDGPLTDATLAVGAQSSDALNAGDSTIAVEPDVAAVVDSVAAPAPGTTPRAAGERSTGADSGTTAVDRLRASAGTGPMPSTTELALLTPARSDASDAVLPGSSTPSAGITPSDALLNEPASSPLPPDPLTKTLELARSRLSSGALIDPQADSALFYLRQAQALAPANAQVKAGMETIFRSLTIRAIGAAAIADWETADRLLDVAARLDGDVTAVVEAREQVLERRIAAESQTLMPMARLERVSLEPARYPMRALRTAVEGWAMIEFTVAVDGTTTNLSVVDTSERYGDQFARAALQAVEEWTFEPRVFRGRKIPQRTRTRLTFDLDN